MDTIPQFLEYQAQIRGSSLAMRAKRLGLWEGFSWSDVRDEVQRFACGLAELGVGRGDTVAVIGGNSPRVFFAITACQCIGAIPSPIYGNLAGEELLHMLKKLSCRCVVAQDQQQVDAVLEVQSDEFKCEMIIYTVSRGMSVYDRKSIYDFKEIQERGEKRMAENPTFYKDEVAAATPDDTAMVLFTSGVGGNPKPATLHHAHILSAAHSLADLAHVNEDDEALSFMPIFLPANLLCGYVLSYVTGMCLSCPESDETVLDNLREISPSVLYASPHVYKQIYSLIHERIRLSRGLPKRLCTMFIDKQKQWPILDDILVKSPIREMYGFNRLRLALSGGDSINAGVLSFFKVLGVNLRQIYGTAETFGCIAMQSQEGGYDDVGEAADKMQVKISSEGEVMVKGGTVFTGYYQDEQLTASVLDQDGWFRTGDIGSISSSGRLAIVDKFGAVGKLGTGTVEREVKESIYIDEVFVSSDEEQALSAIVTIEDGSVSAWADDCDIRYVGYTDLATKAEVVKLIAQEVEAANARLSGKQPKVKSFLVFHRKFTPQTGELTWTYKIRRERMQDKFKGMLQALHNGRDSFEFDDSHSGSKIDFQIYNL